jgi:hypothetical protein
MGNVARVDIINGTSGGVIGGAPFQTIEQAIQAINNASATGITIWVLPGTYTLPNGPNGIILPANTALRGVNVQTCIIQMTNVTQNTTLLTMGAPSRVEDLTLRLTSQGHYTLKGIVLGGNTTTEGKLRTCVLTVDNSSASSVGTSNVYGVECNGNGTLGSGSFSFNALKGSTINVYSNGGGNKRGVLVSASNVVSTRDLNVYVAKPTDTASLGSYVGVETNDPSSLGSIQLRSTTIGTVGPTGSYKNSDILQTTPSVITNPTYLASPGIQIGPGTDLVTKTAGGRGFSTYTYPMVVYYGLRGNIKSINAAGYLWPGTQGITGGSYPDTTIPPAYFRVQQPVLLSGLSVGLNTAPDAGHSVTVLVRYTPIATGTVTDSAFTVTLSDAQVTANYYNSSLRLATGDRIHVYVSYTGNNANTGHDLTVQLDMF